MKKTVRAIFLTVLAIALFVSAGAFPAKAATGQCEYFVGSNVGTQNYSAWSKPVKSYLSVTSNGQLMRFQGDATAEQYIAEYYDSGYNLLRTVKINKELPIFGAFYTDGRNYYVLSGQVNQELSDSVEVYRLTKYDLNWNRLGSAGLFGANTYIPFDAGSARIDSDGNLLFVRTCHEMYNGHQANVTIEFNTDSMTVVDSFYSVMNIGYGYVSHSFNQFIKLDGGQIIGVDHGDAYPRSVVLCKYNSPYSASGFSKNTSAKDLLTIPGMTGANATGVSVGGFEMSSENYLVAGNTVNLGVSYNAGGTRNIFLAVQPKNLSTSGQVKYITSYPEGDTSPQTPHLVKVNDNAFFLLWEKDGTVFYCKVDGSGNMIGSIYSMEGTLSDCLPVLYNGKLIWYTWKNENTAFYSINTNNLSDTVSESILNGHKFQVEYATEESNVASRVCSVCGYRDSFTTMDGFSVLFWHGIGGYSSISRQQNEGEEYRVSLWNVAPESADNQELELVSSDPSVIEVDGTTFRFVGAGEASLTVRAKYRPSVSLTINFTVSHVLGEETIVREATCSAAGIKSQTCSVCGETVNTEIPALGHDWGDWTVVTQATEEAEGLEERLCRNDPEHKETRTIKKLEPSAADYTEVDAAIAKVPADLSIYTDSSVEALKKVLTSVDRDLKKSDQEKVDEKAKEIEDAIAALTELPADYTALNAAMDKAKVLDKTKYTEDSYAAVQAAMDKYEKDLTISRQADVDALAEEIGAAIDALKTKTNGLYKIDGTWKYYENGVFTKANGLVKCPENNKWYYVENGVLSKKTGLVQILGTKNWFYVENGLFNNKATGVVKMISNGAFFYVKNGKFDNSFTGVATDLSGQNTYYITKGKVNAKATGIFADGKQWKYFANGKFTASTGLAQRQTDKKWIYVEKGVLSTKTGLVQRISDKKWFFVQNGVFNSKFSGGVQRVSDNKWFYVAKGQLNKATGLAKCTDGKYRFFKNGVFNTYSGKVKLIGTNKEYKVQNGMLVK